MLMKAEEVENVCEHGDHPAPAGHRFCSYDCQICDGNSNNGCDGFCERCDHCGHTRAVHQGCIDCSCILFISEVVNDNCD